MSPIRNPIVAGAFYPGAARQLEQEISAFLARVEPVEIEGEILGLISPHAGYAYSGPTAAAA